MAHRAPLQFWWARSLKLQEAKSSLPPIAGGHRTKSNHGRPSYGPGQGREDCSCGGRPSEGEYCPAFAAAEFVLLCKSQFKIILFVNH
jgi:hypothetical protein